MPLNESVSTYLPRPLSTQLQPYSSLLSSPFFHFLRPRHLRSRAGPLCPSTSLILSLPLAYFGILSATSQPTLTGTVPPSTPHRLRPPRYLRSSLFLAYMIKVSSFCFSGCHLCAGATTDFYSTQNNAASTSPSFTHNSLPRPPRHLASPETGRLLLASSYPRKKQGELFNPPASSSRLAPPPSPQAGLSPPRPLPADALPSPSPAGDEVIPEDAHLGAFPSILQFFRNERRGLIEDDRARKRKIAAEAEVRRALHRQTKAASTAPVSPLINNNKEGPILAVEQASLKHILPSGFAPLSSPSLLSYSSDDASISITSTRPTSIVSTSPRQSEKHVPTSLFSSPGTASMLSPASNFREDVQPVSPRRPSQLKRLAVQLDLSFPNDKFTIQRGLLSLEQEAAAVKAAGVGDAVVSSSPAQTQGSNVVHVFIDQ